MIQNTWKVLDPSHYFVLYGVHHKKLDSAVFHSQEATYISIQ